MKKKYVVTVECVVSIPVDSDPYEVCVGVPPVFDCNGVKLNSESWETTSVVNESGETIYERG